MATTAAAHKRLYFAASISASGNSPESAHVLQWAAPGLFVLLYVAMAP
jgi:fructoselysine-6-P-deglycase FrlB-like protein